ncbi:MAG: alginate export family protein [Desulfobacula sp.]|nr:alginate export family protein [Desulfobacula sp.]
MINNNFSKFIFSITIIVFFLLGTVLTALCEDINPGLTRSKSAEEKKASLQYTRQLEKRISDLEDLVNLLLQEKQVSGDIPVPKTQAPQKTAETEALESSDTDEDGEWGSEEEVETVLEGRDRDARRRVTELETWRRKLDSKKIKEEEEESKKVKFEFSGKYKLHFNSRNNFDLNNSGREWPYDNTSYFDYRFMLKTEASYGPLATIFTIDKGNFTFDWKEDSEGTLERWSEFFTVNSAWVREVYFQFTGPFLLKAGRQNITDTHGGIVLEGPGDAIRIESSTISTPFGKVSASLAYLAVAGGFSDYTDFNQSGGSRWGDRKAIFGIANKLDGWYLNVPIKPVRNLTIEPYVLKVFDRGEAVNGDPDLNLDKDFNASTQVRDGSFEPLYTGMGITGTAGRFSYKADFIYLSGSYSDTRDIESSAMIFKGDYRWDRIGPLDNFSLGLELARGSGNDASDSETTGTVKDFNGLWLCKDRRKFGNIFSEDLRAGYFFWDSSLANITFVKGSMGFKPLNNLSVDLSVLKLWTTEPVFKGRGPVYDWSLGTSTTTDTTQDVGWEINLNLGLQVLKNWKLYTEIGYFLPGDAYQLPSGESADYASEFILGSEILF